MQVTGASCQRFRNCPLAGPDLDDDVVVCCVHGADDRIDYAGVRQEVLTEALACTMLCH